MGEGIAKLTPDQLSNSRRLLRLLKKEKKKRKNESNIKANKHTSLKALDVKENRDPERGKSREKKQEADRRGEVKKERKGEEIFGGRAEKRKRKPTGEGKKKKKREREKGRRNFWGNLKIDQECMSGFG